VSALDVKSQNQTDYQCINRLEPSEDHPQGFKMVVVIPAYNEARFIGSTVLKALDFTNCVLVVDDGSDDETARIAKAAGATVVRHECNLGKGAALNSGLRECRQLGAQYVVTLDADGQHLPEEMLAVDEYKWDHQFDVNTKGAFFLSQAIAQHMIKRGIEGNIINIASFAAQMPSYESGVYAASKAALVSLTKSMAAEWAKFGINVNCISPGVFPSPMTEGNIVFHRDKTLAPIANAEFGDPFLIAKLVDFLITGRTYITGANIPIDGGKFLIQDQEKAHGSSDSLQFHSSESGTVH